MTKPPQTGDIYIEFHVIGHLVKVSAIDSKSLTEVSIFGPANTPQEQLKATAIKKLHYVLAKKLGE
ncbi:MAG: hypothetical protein MK052_09735 [Alphaproteobacteria bacterium]|nr:hypothetical protein [Alphaproteobacteria bacterium]